MKALLYIKNVPYEVKSIIRSDNLIDIFICRNVNACTSLYLSFSWSFNLAFAYLPTILTHPIDPLHIFDKMRDL